MRSLLWSIFENIIAFNDVRSNKMSTIKLISSHPIRHLKSRSLNGLITFNCRHKSTQDENSLNVTKAQLRVNAQANIAKHFNNVSLVNFPLAKLTDLIHFKEIEKVHNECHTQNLDENPNFYPSISSILSQTMPPESVKALKRWETEKIKKLGFDGFLTYKKELFSRGKILHKNIQTYLETKDSSKLEFTSKNQENIWKSIEHVIPNIGVHYASEMSVHHPFLKYRGIIDCVATYHDVPTIFEWKTSEKLRPTIAHTYDNPLQAVAYYSCLQYDLGYPIPEVKNVILVIAYEDGSKANVHILEPNYRAEIWKRFLKRLEQYWSQMATNSISPANE